MIENERMKKREKMDDSKRKTKGEKSGARGLGRVLSALAAWRDGGRWG